MGKYYTYTILGGGFIFVFSFYTKNLVVSWSNLQNALIFSSWVETKKHQLVKDCQKLQKFFFQEVTHQFGGKCFVFGDLLKVFALVRQTNCPSTLTNGCWDVSLSLKDLGSAECIFKGIIKVDAEAPGAIRVKFFFESRTQWKIWTLLGKQLGWEITHFVVDAFYWKRR